MIYKYYTSGEETSKEGVTLATSIYTNEGVFVAGIEDIENKLYHIREVTKEVYDGYAERMGDPEQRGMYGVVNEVGRAAYLAWLEEKNQQSTEPDKPINTDPNLSPAQEALVTTFFNKLVQENFISESEISDLAVILGCPSKVITILRENTSDSGTTP